jgi:hypothetical protein
VRTCCCLALHTLLAFQRSRCSIQNRAPAAGHLFVSQARSYPRASQHNHRNHDAELHDHCPPLSARRRNNAGHAYGVLEPAVVIRRPGQVRSPSSSVVAAHTQTTSPRGSRRQAVFGEFLHGAGHPESDRSLMFRTPVRRVDLLTGAFSSYQVHINEISILSSFQFFYLLSISKYGKSPVCASVFRSWRNVHACSIRSPRKN